MYKLALTWYTKWYTYNFRCLENVGKSTLFKEIYKK